MYFRNYGFSNTWLENATKVPFQRYPQYETWQTSRITDSISATAPLPYLLTTVNVIQFEKVTVSDMQNLKTLC